MKRYRVTISYRPHVSSLERYTTNYLIEARNKQAALVRAGWFMHLNEQHHVADSLNVTIEAL